MGIDHHSGVATVDVVVRIPELEDVGAFWLRDYPSHYTFLDLYHECLNQPEVLGSRRSLEKIKASRHFWFGERMMLKGEPVAAAAANIGRDGRPEISLVLRRDAYRVGPERYTSGGLDRTYIAAEALIGEVIPQILSREERECCFDLCDHHGRRLPRDMSLSDCGLPPAREDVDGEFPSHACLTLKPRTSWQPYVLLAAAVAAGLLLGYWLVSVLLRK